MAGTGGWARKLDGVLVQGFLYRELNPVAELNAAGTVVSRFVYGTKPHVPDYMSSSGGIFRILSDHLGSVRLVVDASSGVVRQRIDYDQFGQITLREEYDAAGLLLPAGTPPFQPFGFAGGLYDPDTGLVRFGARDYDPEVGRWTAKDPIRFAGGDPNLYEYTFSDPVNFTDPSGRIIPLLAFIGAATGGFQAANAAEDLGLTGFNKAAAIAFGAATGGAAGVAPGLAGISGPLAGVAASAFAGAIGGASGDAAAQLLAGSSNSCSVIESAKEGALSGLIGGGVSGLLGNTPAGQLAGALATSAAALFLDQTDPPPTR